MPTYKRRNALGIQIPPVLSSNVLQREELSVQLSVDALSYVENNFGPGEKVYRGDIHWAIALPWFVVAGFFLLLGGKYGLVIASNLFAIGCLRIVIARLMYEYAITNKRVVLKRGIIFRDTIELNLSKLESAMISQGIIGRSLGYGTLIFRGSGGTVGACKYLANPTDFRRALNHAIEGDSPAHISLAQVR